MTWQILAGLVLGLLMLWLGVLLARWLDRDAAIVVHDQVDTSVVLQTAALERERTCTPAPVRRAVRPLRPMPDESRSGDAKAGRGGRS